MARLQKPSKNIAAIDFGTKNCSLAYITKNDRLELTQGVPKLPLNGTYLRVPTAILFNQEGQVEAFGHDARTLYGNLEDYERECYFYFEEIKMNLRRDQVSENDLQRFIRCLHHFHWCSSLQQFYVHVQLVLKAWERGYACSYSRLLC